MAINILKHVPCLYQMFSYSRCKGKNTAILPLAKSFFYESMKLVLLGF